MTVNRKDLIKDTEKKTEIITIRSTPSLKKRWQQFLLDHQIRNSEDGLRFAIQSKEMDFDVTVRNSN